MIYEIITFIGDFPLENQPNWRVKFTALNDAINAAKIQHKKINDDKTYTVVLDSADCDHIIWMTYKNVRYSGLKAQKIADDLARR